MIDAVVFDFDGVLADSERLHLRALTAAFAVRGWTLTEADYFTHYLGYDDRGCIAAFAQREGLTIPADVAAQVLEDKTRRYLALLAAGDVLFPTARPCIERLAQDVPLAIASGSLRGEIEHILSANGLRHHFQVIVGADDVLAGKPAPDSYVQAVAALGVAPTRAVAIEDSPWGLQSARGAGLRTIGISTSYPKAALTDADTVIDSLDEVSLMWLRTLGLDEAEFPEPA